MPLIIEKDWTTKAGFRAVVGMTDMGHRCGYVGVSTDHRLFGANYSEPHPALRYPSEESIGKRGIIPLIVSEGKHASPDVVFDVHGSITYSGGSDTYPVPRSGLWWFGYDCGHAGDARDPKYKPDFMPDFEDGVLRTLEYCEAECESLAQQLIDRVEGAQA